MLNGEITLSDDVLIACQKNIEGYQRVEDVNAEIESAVGKIIERGNFSRIKIVKVLLSKLTKGEEIFKVL